MSKFEKKLNSGNKADATTEETSSSSETDEESTTSLSLQKANITGLDNFIPYCVSVSCSNEKGSGDISDEKMVPFNPGTRGDFAFLKSLWDNTNGAQWKNKWKLDGQYCEEYGVTCEQGRVVRLNLMDNGLDGYIPYSIGNLTDCVEILLSKNRLEGSLPASIENLSKLNSLYLSENLLRREIPKGLFKIKSLKHLYLDNNLFFGEVYFELIAEMENLVHLRLGNNSLSGQFNVSIFSLPNLVLLDLSMNVFYGELDFPDTKNETLTIVDLRSNKLEGEIPENIVNLKRVKNLLLEENILGGSLPKRLSECTTIEKLTLNANQFTGNLSDVKILLKPLNLKEVSLGDNWWSCPLEPWDDLAPITDYKKNGSNACWCSLTEWSDWSSPFPCCGEGSVYVKSATRSVEQKEEDGGYCFDLVKYRVAAV